MEGLDLLYHRMLNFSAAFRKELVSVVYDIGANEKVITDNFLILSGLLTDLKSMTNNDLAFFIA